MSKYLSSLSQALQQHIQPHLPTIQATRSVKLAVPVSIIKIKSFPINIGMGGEGGGEES